MEDEVHIASFVVRHRADAAAAIDAMTQSWPGLEVGGRDDTGTILLHESTSPRALLDCMDAVQGVRGVMSVNLVYHHAEPRAALDRAMPRS